MNNRIMILNHYAGSMFFNKAGRHYCFAKYLRQAGYNPVVFVANSKHGSEEKWIKTDDLYVEKYDEEIDVNFVFIKARPYTRNGLDRVMNMIDYYRNVKVAVKEYAKKHGVPDVMYASSVHPLTLLAGINLAKHFKVKCLCEVRDLWPESIVAFNSRWSKKNPIIKALYLGEYFIYKKADKILFTFEGGYDYIKDKHWNLNIPKDKVYYINNGIDLDKARLDAKTQLVYDKDLNDEEIFKIIYTGSIRHANNLGMLLDVAKEIRNGKIRFLVWGDGDELEKLKKRVINENIHNVVFKGRVEKKYIPYIVSKANMNYIHCQSTEMDYKYGISFNKIFDYLAAGKPILCDVETIYNPVMQEGAGFEIRGTTPAEIAHEIDSIVDLPIVKQHEKTKNAVIAAEKYDYKILTKKLIEIIEK